jgi:glutathione S-transferase
VFLLGRRGDFSPFRGGIATPSRVESNHVAARPRGEPKRKENPLMNISLNVIASLGASLVRPTRGAVAVGHRKAPRKMLEFYEGEYCPFCRYVRETLTALDLDAKIYPIPKRGSRFKQRLVELGGKPKVPFLYDPNSRKGIYESEAIAAYLYDRYGLEGHRAPPRAISTSTLATTLRGKSGMFAVPSKAPAKPLELYSFEACPYARLVRESLCELEIPYVLHNVGKGASRADWLPAGYREIAMKDYVPGTRNREALLARGGRMVVPYLVDPNTRTAMYEAWLIQEYLRRTYGA